MEVQFVTQPLQDIKTDALVIGAAYKTSKDGESSVLLSTTATTVDTLLNGLVSERSAAGEFKGSIGQILTIYPMGKLAAQRIIVVGLGAQAKVDVPSMQWASAIVARHLQSTGAQHIVMALQWETEQFSLSQGVQAQVEGVLLGSYAFRKYQHNSEKNSKNITQLHIFVDSAEKADLAYAIHKGQALAQGTNFARDLVNEPPCVLTPKELANRASTMARDFGLECEIWEKEKIQELRMGGLLAVSQGSAEPPYFIILRYRGAPESTEKGLALVGKGITFDTGGISIKPAERMDEMKGDMGGAAAVLGAMHAIAELKPQTNVTAFVPTCENMPSGTAYRPGDIVRIMNGKTVEIVNTDAEGRLILADALSYATQEGFSPIIDLATLTGAVVVALGHTMTGLFSNDEPLTNEIVAAGRTVGEKFWPMPMDDEYQESIKSDIADIKQTGGRPAASITAAKILEHFVGSAKWAHLDIAGTSYVDSN